MPPKLNRRRAEFVLSRIDAILAWETQHENARDTKFVELGKYLREVRAGQYWRVENLKSFDEFLARRFPESRRKAYYLEHFNSYYAPKQLGCNLEAAIVRATRCQNRSRMICGVSSSRCTTAAESV